MREKLSIAELKNMACKIKKEIIQLFVEYGHGHYGGCLSCVDIITVLYFHTLSLDPNNTKWEQRDRFVLSKGHAGTTMYAALANLGIIDKDELFTTYKKKGSRFGIHPDMRGIPGVEMSTGSLGHGFSVAVGMALAGKMDGNGYKVFSLLGDGECQEGLIWEAAMTAGHYALDNLVAIVDRNKMSMDGPVCCVMNLEPFVDKWKAFGWEILETDGHDIESLVKHLEKVPFAKNKPSLLVADTVKGKGVSFMENKSEWHSGSPSKEELKIICQEIEISL